MTRRSKKRARKKPGPDYRDILKRIHPVANFDPESKVVIYGKAGKGKTTLACSFPKPILLLDVKEKGTDSVRDQKNIDAIRVENWGDLDMLYWYLKKDNHKYKTFVWDTTSQLQRLCIENVLEEHNVEGEPGWWGTMSKRDWGKVSTQLSHAILDWRDLKMNGVFIAHDRVFEGVENEDDEEEGLIEPSVGPNLIPSVVNVLNAAVGVIGNTFVRERIKEIKIKGKKKKKTKKVLEYCLRVGPHAYYITKIRNPKKFKVPQVIVDPTYKKILAVITGE